MSRKFSFRCPSCLARIKAPPEFVGDTRKCPACACLLVVPEPTKDRKTAVAQPAQAQPVLISQADTVEMCLECEDVKSGHSSHLEKLDAEGARVKRLVEDYARHVGFDQDKRAAS